ncbi:hypothetical protein D3C81_1967740 [compost metagenome]
MTNENDRCTCLLGIADHRLRGRSHLSDCSGGRVCHIGPQCLDGIDDDQIGPLAVGNGGKNVFDIGFSGQFDCAGCHAKSLRTQTNLCDCFFARYIDDAVAVV